MISRLLLVLVLVGACYGKTESEVTSWFFGFAAACNDDFPITIDEMAMMKQLKLPDSPNAKCLMGCMLKKADMIDDKGFFDVEKTETWIETEFTDDPKLYNKAKKVFACKRVNDEPVSDGNKGCDRGYQISKCLLQNLAAP